MAHIEFSHGAPKVPGWCFREMDFGRTHQWLDEATQDCANVHAGEDSHDRAKSLLYARPRNRMIEVTDKGAHIGFMFFDEETWGVMLAKRRSQEEEQNG